MLLNFCQQNSKSLSSEQLELFLVDIFDKVSCYFPINFTPPKDDKFKITPSRLQQSLNHCFLATEHKEWVDSILPFVLDKMDADANSRKVCLELLKLILDKFDHNGHLKDHL